MDFNIKSCYMQVMFRSTYMLNGFIHTQVKTFAALREQFSEIAIIALSEFD